MAVYSDVVDDEPRYYDARIVGVISNAIRNNKRVVVIGPRDVGKSLYFKTSSSQVN
jgi:ABC-type iron transport system FetAB ATPase subunit